MALALTGAAVNIFTTCIATVITGNTYTLADLGVAFAAGFINAFSGWGSLAAGAISGAWAGYLAYKNGATIFGALLSGAASATATVLSISNLSIGSGAYAEIAEIALVDATFGTGYNTIASTVSTAATALMQRDAEGNTATVSITSGGGASVKRLFR